MFSIRYNEPDFVVDPDPGGFNAELLEYMLSDPIESEWTELCSAHGPGFSLPHGFFLYRVEEQYDIPEVPGPPPPGDFKNEELWILYLKYKEGQPFRWYRGEELRKLLAAGQAEKHAVLSAELGEGGIPSIAPRSG